MSSWLYVQSTGDLFRPDGTRFALSYAGNGKGKDQPSKQHVRNVGPLPAGFYRIGKARAHPKLGPVSIPLEPDRWNSMFGRSAFYIHGDSATNPGNASQGCIVTARAAREEIAQHEGEWLRVEPVLPEAAL